MRAGAGTVPAVTAAPASGVQLQTAVAARYTQAELRRLRREWAARLKADGFDDIEGVESGMLRGISLQEVARAPSREEIDETRSYYSIAAEWLGVRAWPDAREQRVWQAHVDGTSLRPVAKAEGISLKRAWEITARLQDECAAWWRDVTEEDLERPGRGRPRVENPRRESVRAWVTREERGAIREAAARAGVDAATWMRRVLLHAAANTPHAVLSRKQYAGR